MKRIALMIALFLLFGDSLAESFDFANFTDEEIVKLIDAAKDELFSRGVLRSGDLIIGKYVIGKDIAAGNYVARAADDSKLMSVIKMYEPDKPEIELIDEMVGTGSICSYPFQFRS